MATTMSCHGVTLRMMRTDDDDEPVPLSGEEQEVEQEGCSEHDAQNLLADFGIDEGNKDCIIIILRPSGMSSLMSRMGG
ncbi:unnamed protein product [Urochloa humidicola]